MLTIIDKINKLDLVKNSSYKELTYSDIDQKKYVLDIPNKRLMVTKPLLNSKSVFGISEDEISEMRYGVREIILNISPFDEVSEISNFVSNNFARYCSREFSIVVKEYGFDILVKCPKSFGRLRLGKMFINFEVSYKNEAQ